jgi:glutamate-1-semialdehyde 2,1-aminomutase
MAIGLATLRNLTGRVYEVLEEVGRRVSSTLLKLAEEFGDNPVLNRVGSMFTIFFTDGRDVRNYRDAKSSDLEAFRNFFKALLRSGVLMPPSQFEASFVTVSHSKVVRDLERMLGGEGR